jgi:cell division septation protein DedD
MTERRVYTPDFEVDEYGIESGDGGRRRMMVGGLMAIVVLALGAAAWNTYARSSDVPSFTLDDPSFKTMAPEAPAPAIADRELYDIIEGQAPPPLVTKPTPAADGRTSGAALSAPQAPAAPVANMAPAARTATGAEGFVVQIAALRSRQEAEEAWRLFGDRAPGLQRSAEMSVQRADLGPQGVFYRLRAGYFETREKASAYCERAKALGQECMVVVR